MEYHIPYYSMVPKEITHFRNYKIPMLEDGYLKKYKIPSVDALLPLFQLQDDGFPRFLD